jgi:hypothetical protein
MNRNALRKGIAAIVLVASLVCLPVSTASADLLGISGADAAWGKGWLTGVWDSLTAFWQNLGRTEGTDRGHKPVVSIEAGDTTQSCGAQFTDPDGRCTNGTYGSGNPTG